MKRKIALMGVVTALAVSFAPAAQAATGGGDGCTAAKHVIVWLGFAC